jgi:hypothetical protein
MAADRYTKFILTVIAACLLWLCAMSSGLPVLAQARPGTALLGPLPAQPVVIVGYGRLNARSPNGVDIAWADQTRGLGEEAIAVRSLDEPRAKPLRVRIDGPQPLSVRLDEIRQTGAWDAVRTRVEKEPAQAKPGDGR